jgi:hypothetical protein
LALGLGSLAHARVDEDGEPGSREDFPERQDRDWNHASGSDVTAQLVRGCDAVGDDILEHRFAIENGIRKSHAAPRPRWGPVIMEDDATTGTKQEDRDGRCDITGAPN